MKKNLLASSFLLLIAFVPSCKVHATLTDDETRILAKATPAGLQTLASRVVTGGFNSLEDWLASLGAPVVPPVDADIQGLLATLGPIPVGTVPLTRTGQALALKGKLDGGSLTIEQAMTSVDTKVGAVAGGDLALKTDAIRNALDSSIGVVDVATGLQNVQAKFVGLVGADMTAQAGGVVDALDSTLVVKTLNNGLASVQAKFVGLAGADMTAQADTAIDVLDSNPLVTTLNGALVVIGDMKAALGNDAGGGANIVGAARLVGNYPLINSVTSTLAPKVDFADARDIATYLVHINQ